MRYILAQEALRHPESSPSLPILKGWYSAPGLLLWSFHTVSPTSSYNPEALITIYNLMIQMFTLSTQTSLLNLRMTDSIAPRYFHLDALLAYSLNISKSYLSSISQSSLHPRLWYMCVCTWGGRVILMKYTHIHVFLFSLHQ